MSKPQNDGEDDQEQVFQDPCLPIDWTNRGDQPDNRASRRQTRDEFSLPVQRWSVRGSRSLFAIEISIPLGEIANIDAAFIRSSELSVGH